MFLEILLWICVIAFVVSVIGMIKYAFDRFDINSELFEFSLAGVCVSLVAFLIYG